jgi:hypothetical protein
MEVVHSEPVAIGPRKATRRHVGEGAEAARIVEDEIDHLRGDAEVGQDQRRYAGCQRLQRRRRRHGDECPGGAQRLVHRTRSAPDGAHLDTALTYQVCDEVGIGPGLPVGLLFAVRRPQLHHR